MSHADAAIGMMDGAYFVSRNEILTFLNTLLDLNLKKVEETASGAVACQLTEYIFPGSVPMSRVNWAARSSHEYVGNYKLLQNAFNKQKVQRHVDVDKLIRGKYQDNLEFCQWLKAFYDQTAPMMSGAREGYDPVATRAKGKGGKMVAKGGAGKKPSARSGGAAPSRTVGASSRTGTTGASRPTSGGSSSSSRVTATSSARGQKENTANASSSRLLANNPRKASATSAAAAAKYEEEIRTLKSENTTLKSKLSELEHTSADVEMNLQTVESERDFYFEKLRGVEVMLQVYKEKEDSIEGSGDVIKVMDSIFKVMYATMDDNVVVDDEGNLLGDITMESSIDKSALLSVKAQDELLGEEEEDGIIESIEKAEANDITEEKVIVHQFSEDDSDDLLDDDELLTSGLGGEGDDNEFKECIVASSVHDDDDDFSSDEDLLAD